MELTVLGNNGTCPAKDGACSSFLVEVDKKRILIDMGNGSIAKLQQKWDIWEIDMIIISHLHFDHMADLFPFKYAIETKKALGEEIKKIDLLIPETPQWITEEITINEVFNIINIYNGTVYELNNIRIEFKKVEHLIDSYAVRIEYGNKIFVYSSDSGDCPELEEIARDADLFLCEATFLECERVGINHHLSAMQAGKIALNARVKNMLLTHFSNPLATDEYCSEARLNFLAAEASKILGTYKI